MNIVKAQKLKAKEDLKRIKLIIFSLKLYFIVFYSNPLKFSLQVNWIVEFFV